MTAKEILQMMPRMINPKTTEKVKALYHFKLTGKEPGDYCLEVNCGKGYFREGAPEHPSLVMEMPSDVWIQIANGEIIPALAFQSGQLKVKGNFIFMIQFSRYFSGDNNSDKVPDGLYSETENERLFREEEWLKPKKVLGIQGSPRGMYGATEIIYDLFLQGVKDAGCETETIYLAEKDILMCRGCLECWRDPKGECVLKDGMKSLIQKVTEADLMVLATPLIMDGMSAYMKVFLDRLIPLTHPYIFQKKGRSLRPSRVAKMPDVALVSVCSYLEMENFDPLVKQIEAICRNLHMNLQASVLRSTAMMFIEKYRPKGFTKVTEAIRKAGKEIVETGKLSQSLKKDIQKSVLTKGQYFAGCKDWWKHS